MENNNKKFLNNELIKMVAATVIGRSVYMVANSFVNDFIEPIINQDYNDDGIKDGNQLQNFNITVYNSTIKLGHFIITVMTVFLSVLLLYSLHRIFL